MPWEKRSCEAVSCQQGGSFGTPHHLRSSYRWWITSGNRNACGPCGSCYPLALVEAAGVRRQPQPIGKQELGKGCCASPRVDLHKPVPGSHVNRDELRADKGGCPNAVWAPGSWFRTILPLLSISSLIRKRTSHVKASLYRMHVSKSN